MGKHDIGNGMVGPLVVFCQIYLIKRSIPARRAREFMPLRLMTIGISRHASACVQGDCSVASRCPESYPVGESCPASTMDQHNCRNSRRGRVAGNSVPRKDTSWIALPG